CILEGFVDFHCEISVIAARGLDGAIATFVPVENRHRAQILDLTIAPARLPASLLQEAEEMARRIAGRLDLCGTVAVEMFLGRDGRLMVNELAPRVHNSGHWTIEACLTSQFQQHVRAICGLPLGSTARHADATMRNLIGHDADAWAEILRDPANRLHLYGKSETRPGRKMGHVTRLLPLGAGGDLADF
ncbi:MAG: ATP-grasp domain-containing protein, partial [Alphaproteobacteria bacterium]|nr:ATP-grasp domain-containing protein [Alphaproteobacteria bacterium]